MPFRAETPCRGRGGGGPAGTAGRGPTGEVKACVNVLNIVRKRHLQLPTRRGAKGKGSEGVAGGNEEGGQVGSNSAGTKTRGRLRRVQAP